MELDYAEIGKRIARRRKELGLKQAEVCARAGINDKYLSCIERATSIPSLDVVIRLAHALDTTPDEFLTGTIRHQTDQWRDVAEMLRNMNSAKLSLAKMLDLVSTTKKTSTSTAICVLWINFGLITLACRKRMLEVCLLK